MNLEITSLNPFVVSFRLYNLLGEIDGHPKVIFDMTTGEYKLVHDKGFANLVSMSDHPRQGEPISVQDASMHERIRKMIEERVGHTGFHDEWATVAFNKHYVGNTKYPRYFFTMWNYDEDGELLSYRYIGEKEYAQIAV